MASDTRARTWARWVLGLLLIGQGINHFVMTDEMVRIMPSFLPWHRPLVWLSGAAEIGLGAMALSRRTRRLAGWGIIALLVAVWPANWTMALNAEAWPSIPEWALWTRLPFQLVFAWWAWASCIAPAQR